MITTSRAPRNDRLLIVAFLLSAIIHLIGGGLWPRAGQLIAKVMHRLPQQHMREADVATSDVVTIERRTVPRPAVRSRALPLPRHAVRPVPPAVARVAQATRPLRPAVPHPAVSPPPKAPPTAAPTAPPELTHRARHAPRAAPDAVPTPGLGAAPAVRAAPEHAAEPARTSALSAVQIAALNAQFAQTIAATHVDLATIQKQTEERPVATKRYPLQFAGLQATLERGEGYIEPITAGQRIGNSVWYYTHYTYMWPDGHLEDDDIPWPFHYPVNHDLFALHIRWIPLQLPPPGFRFTRPLKPFLARFVERAGQG